MLANIPKSVEEVPRILHRHIFTYSSLQHHHLGLDESSKLRNMNHVTFPHEWPFLFWYDGARAIQNFIYKELISLHLRYNNASFIPAVANC